MYFVIHYNIVFSRSKSSLYSLITKFPSLFGLDSSRIGLTINTRSKYTTNRGIHESNDIIKKTVLFILLVSVYVFIK